ncbi:hypothetical protein SAMN05421805_11778 [Saccharopolyspora antimicrobica]|uniref:Proteins of 100 residues with WXG n=1 Tax=Saccharopolyspora antimicrobica TaxID=455193 RepID=A0A1I5I3B1_9PSEU|nr:hypothetical protein [Saccharopolyspora antimicrobica]RKT83061.1 hypothetical protein ATL45_1334 [Saccharopolyspora antimicrobica]SFO55108.1 hypothetical protein SAMN05421805_11778 [Saccharopolyspora antimicrobica]
MSKFGYDDGMLTQVISATDNALGQMRQLNNSVSGVSGQLPAVNNSTSGMKLSRLLNDWSTDYNKIVTELENLKGKATGLLQTNRNVETETGGAAQ